MFDGISFSGQPGERDHHGGCGGTMTALRLMLLVAAVTLVLLVVEGFVFPNTFAVLSEAFAY